MPDSQNNINNTKTAVLSITSPVSDDKMPIPTICINVDERNNNNNTIGLASTKARKILQCLPEIFTNNDINRGNSINNHLNNNVIVKGDLYKPYIFGKFKIITSNQKISQYYLVVYKSTSHEKDIITFVKIEMN